MRLLIFTLLMSFLSASSLFATKNKVDLQHSTTAESKKEIVFVKTAANNNDSIVIANLTNYANGMAYNVTVIEQSVITADLLAQLNAADLVIMGRSLPSGDVATGIDVWSQITAPVLSMNMWGMRSSRAKWTPSASCANLKNADGVFFQGTILVPGDPVFQGVSGETIDWWSGNYSAFGADAENDDFGNGTLLAKTAEGAPLFMRWNAGVEYYPGSGQVPQSERSYIGNGSDDGGIINYFAFSDDAKKIFFNEVARMAGAKPQKSLSDVSVIFVTDDNEDAEQIDWLASKGLAVTKYYPTAGLAAAPAEEVAALNAADLVIIGRSPSSSDFQSAENKAAWNNLTAPVILNSQWVARNTRMNMFNSATAIHADASPDIANAEIMDAADPAFSLVEITDGKLDWTTKPHDFITSVAETNGTILARWDEDVTAPLFARFEANVEYYAGSVDMPAGPRTYFGFGNDVSSTHFFPLTENARKVYWAEILNLLGLPIEDTVAPETGDPYAIFDPATVDPSTLADGMSIVEVNGKKLLKVAINEWNSIINVPAFKFEPGMRAYAEFKYVVGQTEFPVDKINAAVQLIDTVNTMTVSWSTTPVSSTTGLIQSNPSGMFVKTSADAVATFKVVHQVQFFGQQTVSWGAVKGDTFWVGKIRAYKYEPNTIFDPVTYDPDELAEGMEVVEVDGKPYLKVDINAWNSIVAVPEFKLNEGVKAVAEFKYVVNQTEFTAAQINAAVQLIDTVNTMTVSWSTTPVASTTGLIQSNPTGKFVEVKAAITETMKLVHQVQFFGQQTVSWGAVAGDVMWVSKVTVEEPVAAAPITFIVDDSKLMKYDGFSIRGSWITETGVFDSGWNGGVNHAQFTDANNDHKWELTLNLIPDGGVNTWHWGFLDLSDNWLVTGPDPEFTVVDASAQTLTYIIGGTGVSDMASELKVYPNPVENVLNVAGVEVDNISIYNLSGSKLQSSQLSNNSVDVSGLAKGSYIVKIVNSDGETSISKFTKR